VKLATHKATALLTTLYFVDGVDDPVALAMLYVAVIAGQHALDAFGHSWVTVRGKRFPRRNTLHSLPGVIAWGLLFGSPFAFNHPELTAAVVAGMIVHYLEDAVTEGGVYLWKRRRRLPFRIDYDNPVVNKATILAFLALTAPAAMDLLEGGSVWQSLYAYAVISYSLYAFLYA